MRALGSLLVQRFAAIFIGLLILAHAMVPALPKYVCNGMGGMHLLHPCCPDQSADHQDAQAAWQRGRCCESEPASVIEAQRLPRPDQVRVLAAVSEAATYGLPILYAPVLPAPIGSGTARGDPTLIAPQPRLFLSLHVLRI